MDGISGAAAVIGLVQAATQVTTTLSRYVSRVREAESARAKLHDQIQFISAAETAISSIIQNSPRSVHEEDLQILIDKWFKEDGPPKKCKRELDALAAWLEKETGTKRQRWMQKISWPVKEDKIQATIRVFEGYMPYFRDILSIRTFHLVETMATRLKNDELVSMKLELLRWLDGFDCTDKHESTLRQRRQTTGKWLFSEELYINWRNGSTKFVWLHGKAGAGKSVLASAIIDDRLSGLAENETLAYFYCDFRNIRCTRAIEVFRSITKQLLLNSTKDWLSLFSDLTARKHRGTGPPTDLRTLSDLLRRAAELHERPVVVVDALDECEDLSSLLGELAGLANSHCLLFVTSRTLQNIKEAFEHLPTISLDERMDEMRNDIHFHIQNELDSRSRLKVLKQDLKDTIEGVLMQKADGMFRWVQCQLDRLNDCYSLGDIHMVLATLPETLYETYDQMLRAIDKKPLGVSRAQRALTWLVTALEPLTLSQLMEAMSISCDEPAWDYDNAPIYGDAILDILGSLVRVEKTGVITLSHYSVKEYLTSNTLAHTGSKYFVYKPNASLELTKVSIFSLILSENALKPTMHYKGPSLRRYAHSFGLRHIADCPSNCNDLLLRHLFALEHHISMHRHGLICRPEWLLDSTYMLTSPHPALRIIIRLGHPMLLRHYLDCCTVRITEEDNPLVFGALYSDVPRMEILLGMGFDVNLQGVVSDIFNVRKTMPLIAAARNKGGCQNELVKLLIGNGSLVPRDVLHRIFACDIGFPCKPAVVRTLLEHGADPRALDPQRRSCLHVLLAPSWGAFAVDQFEIARMLVAAGCDPMARDIWDTSLLDLSIIRLSLEFLRWLVQSGFKLPRNAILCAFSDIQHANTTKLLDVLQFLIENDADAKIQDADGSNSLHLFSRNLSAFRYCYETIENTYLLLLRNGCKINCRNDARETPLHLAAASDAFTPGILELFLSQGAELPLDIINYVVKGWGPTTRHTLAFLVKKYGASCQSKSINGDNALHCLMKSNPTRIRSRIKYIWEVASFLVKNGCDMHATNSSGETSRQLAIEIGYLSVAQMPQIALSRSAELVALPDRNPDGSSILHRLCGINSDQFGDKARLLSAENYDFMRDINLSNNKGLTPLCIALMLGEAAEKIIPCLLDFGASFRYVDYLDMEDVAWATNLPWYHDATDAHKRYLTRSKTTPGDVILVYHLLAGHQRGLSSAIVRSILDKGEYWACKQVTRKDIPYLKISEPIAFPMIGATRNDEHWIPRRLAFTIKVAFQYFDTCTLFDHSSICIHVKRENGSVFAIPVSFKFFSSRPFGSGPDKPRARFDVWGELTPAKQVGGRRRLWVEDLTFGDTLNVEVDRDSTTNDCVTLAFFQVEVYYSMGPASEASDY